MPVLTGARNRLPAIYKICVICGRGSQVCLFAGAPACAYLVQLEFHLVAERNPLRVILGASQEYDVEYSSTDAPPFPPLPSPDVHATHTDQSMMTLVPSSPPSTYPMDVGITELGPSLVSASQFLSGGAPSQVSYMHATKTARVEALVLAVKGFAPLWVRLDTLTSKEQLALNTPLTLNLQLGTSGPSAFLTEREFSPSLYFTTWTHSEKCITKLFINGQMNSSEHYPLNLTGGGQGYVNAALPKLFLNQCQQLDPCEPLMMIWRTLLRLAS